MEPRVQVVLKFWKKVKADPDGIALGGICNPGSRAFDVVKACLALGVLPKRL